MRIFPYILRLYSKNPMAVRWSLWGFCIFSAFLASVSTTTHSAEVSAADCTNLVLNLADCLSFVVEGSTATFPQGDCCSGLKIVVTTNSECLCEAFKNSAQLGVKLNVSKAMTLPVVCRVSSSSVANCSCKFHHHFWSGIEFDVGRSKF